MRGERLGESPRILWERDQQRIAAAAALAAGRTGHGRALFFLGEAGIGKTTLLDEVCRQAGDDFVVSRVQCEPMETSLPFGVLSQIVHDLGGDHGLVAAAAEHADARTTTLYRTFRWLEEETRCPTVIALDDLHWSDPESLDFVGFLCRRLGRLPLSIVATLRTWPTAAADLAWRLVPRGDATVEPLPPLSLEAATGVLTDRLGQPASADLAECAWRLTGGNPLLLGLAAGHLGNGDTTLVGSVDVPRSDVERSLVLTRFSGLTPDGTRWARAAAVLGIEFHAELVGEVAGLEDSALDAAAEAVWRGGLARAGRQGRSEFVHPLFGQLLYDDMAPPVRARLHARAFTALADRGMDDAAAEHAARANLAGDARAVRVLTEAGQRALRAGAPATAVNRLEAAVRLSGTNSVPPLLELAEAYVEAGRGLDAASVVTRALDTDLTHAEQVAAQTLLSRAQYGRGDLGAAAVALEAAVALAEHESPETVVPPLLWHANAVNMTAGPAASLPLAVRARDVSRGGDPALTGAAKALSGLIAYSCGDPEGFVAAESEAKRVLGAGAAEVAADLRAGYSGTLGPYSIAACYAERFAEAEATLRSGIDETERAGLLTNASAFLVLFGLTIARTRSALLLPVADRLLAFTDLIPLAEPYARTLRSYELLESGRDDESEAEVARARPLASAYNIWKSVLWLDHVEGLRLLRRGHVRSASEVYRAIEERYRELGVGEPCEVPFGLHAVSAHAQAGRLEDAERVVAWLDERGGILPCRWPTAAAAYGRAWLARTGRDYEEADKGYRVAAELLEAASLPLDLAEVLIDHGRLLRLWGRPREARESFRRASELAEPAGGVWLAQRAGAELAAAGGRKRARRGAEQLTAQEERIARLAATGASDKDIASHVSVSVRTVRTHLEHVYAKLAIHSRRELMALGDRLESVIGPKG